MAALSSAWTKAAAVLACMAKKKREANERKKDRRTKQNNACTTERKEDLIFGRSFVGRADRVFQSLRLSTLLKNPFQFYNKPEVYVNILIYYINMPIIGKLC